MKPMTFKLVTLCCKVCQYESQYFREMLEWNGVVEPEEGQPADLCLVNTCTVTHEAEAKGRQALRKLKRLIQKRISWSRDATPRPEMT
ncbi:MAG: hypothetical protein EXR99_06850 [Gemmataceae bacterium]|nr:hypothetical protein [Gemmataceae bacterium]